MYWILQTIRYRQSGFCYLPLKGVGSCPGRQLNYWLIISNLFKFVLCFIRAICRKLLVFPLPSNLLWLSLLTVSPVCFIRAFEREARVSLPLVALTHRDFPGHSWMPSLDELCPLWLGQSSQVSSTGPWLMFCSVLSHSWVISSCTCSANPQPWTRKEPGRDHTQTSGHSLLFSLQIPAPSVASDPDLPRPLGRTTCSAWILASCPSGDVLSQAEHLLV